MVGMVAMVMGVFINEAGGRELNTLFSPKPGCRVIELGPWSEFYWTE